MMGTSVKTERHDDAEINEMARRIIEQNRQKSGQQPGMPPMGYPPHAGQMAMSNRPGQPTIQNYLTNPNGMHLGLDHVISTGRQITNLVSNLECLL